MVPNHQPDDYVSYTRWIFGCLYAVSPLSSCGAQWLKPQGLATKGSTLPPENPMGRYGK